MNAMGTKTPEMLQVVAGVLSRRGRLLLAQRAPKPARSHILQHPPRGFEARDRQRWEFPGGKVEPGESHPHALRRELREEMGFSDLRVHEQIESVAYDGIEVHFYRVNTTETPMLLEHTALGWYRPVEALTLALAVRDKAFLESTLQQLDTPV